MQAKSEKMENNNISGLQGISFNELRKKYGKTPAAFRMMLRTVLQRGYAQSEIAKPDEISAIVAYYENLKKRGSKGNQAPAIISENPKPAQRVNTPAPASQPRRSVPAVPAAVPVEDAKMMFAAPLLVSVVSVCLTIAGLYRFAAWYGVGLGLMFALYLLSAVWVARDRNKGDTSTDALKTVLRAELGACVLHFFTFCAVLPDFGEYQGVPFKYGTALLCAAAVALLSYKAVILVRNYNAEL